MGRHHRRWGIVSAVAAAGVVVAATAWGLGAGTDPAAANGTDGQFCTSNQVVAEMIPETPNTAESATRSYGAIQITARPGEACHLTGAPGATLQGTGVETAADESAPQTVLVTPSTPAWIPLDWSDQASPSAQQTPSTITLDLAGSPDPVVRWTGGGVDSIDQSGPVILRSVRSGVARFGNGG